MHFVQQHRKRLVIGAFLALAPSACADLLSSRRRVLGSLHGPRRVEMIKADQVGVYGIEVIRTDQY